MSTTTSLFAMTDFYKLEMESIIGETIAFDRFRNQVCLLVNVASA